MDIREGETVGEYVTRLEQRLKELEPPEGFTVQEWHVAQVFTYLLWAENDGDLAKWSPLRTAYKERFAEQVRKFATYMGWDKE